MKKIHCKCKRKVIVKCNDMKDRIILTKTVRKKTKKAQSNERIVPCCLRPGCKSGFEYKEASKHHRQKRRNHTPEAYKKVTHKVSYTTILSGKKYLNNESNSTLLYEYISSDSLSSYSDEELETLMKSTRKRMRDLGEEWKLMQRHQKPYTSTPLSNRNKKLSQSLENLSSSFHSLNTLVLEADDEKCTCKNKKLSQSLENLNSSFNSLNTLVLEADDEKLVKQEPYEEELKLDSLFLRQDLYKTDEIKKEYCEKSHIDKVIIKLEDNDNNMDLPKININNFSIKQELYGDL